MCLAILGRGCTLLFFLFFNNHLMGAKLFAHDIQHQNHWSLIYRVWTAIWSQVLYQLTPVIVRILVWSWWLPIAQKIYKLNQSNIELINFIQYLNNDCRYKPKTVNSDNQALTPGEDLTSDYMNILGMILSMCGLLMKVKLI